MAGLTVADILKRVQRIQIVANRAVNDVFAGQYRSVFRGRGMEFDEVREYQPGDDIRTIDWNVTARSGNCFIKRFREERELTIIFLVDVSASGAFGSGCTWRCRWRYCWWRGCFDADVSPSCIPAWNCRGNSDATTLTIFLCPKVSKFHSFRYRYR